tara:strand:- start:3182 stop:3424 length:243 start_codon:yes stop_codon:yes gene_type:complete
MNNQPLPQQPLDPGLINQPPDITPSKLVGVLSSRRFWLGITTSVILLFGKDLNIEIDHENAKYVAGVIATLIWGDTQRKM